MSKTAKGLLIAALCVLTTWMGIACLYTYSVSEELKTLRRESRDPMCAYPSLSVPMAAHAWASG